jgi:periplasmic divalent cation tolerance protein
MTTDASNPSIRVVLVTAPDRDTALPLVRRLVEEGKVACGNILPGLTSVYRWEGQVEEDPEVLIILKTREGALPELISRIHELHPYDVPEILALPVQEGLPAYLEWVVAETMGA